MMQLAVKTQSGEDILLDDVDPMSDNNKKIMYRIQVIKLFLFMITPSAQDLKGIPVEQQRLLFEGVEYLPLRTLSNFPNFNRGSLLSLIHCPIKITVSSRGACSFDKVLRLAGLHTIKFIKANIAENEFIPSSQQILMFNGIRLEDKKTISDYDIKDNSKLQLVLKTQPSSGTSITIKVRGAIKKLFFYF